jgi:hypothetical protein
LSRVIADNELHLRNSTLRLSRVRSGAPPVAPDGCADLAYDSTRGLILSVDGSDYEAVRGHAPGIEDVRSHGAVGDGVTDDRAALVAAIAALPATGGMILIPPGFDCHLSAGVTTGSKPVIFQGTGLSSKISGTGFTILTLAKDKSGLRDLEIIDAVGHASTIAVDVNNGATGVDDWFLENVHLTGTDKNGVGLRQEFALKGTILGGEIKKFNHGVQPNNNGLLRSNANHYSGVKIRENAVGIQIGADDIDDLSLSGCTIEGNLIGISQASGKVSVTATHFEATGGATPTNVTVAGGNFSSFGCYYGGAGGIRDVIVTAGSGVHTSFADNFSNGITHNGTGTFFVQAPANALSSTGTGAIQQLKAAGFDGDGGTSALNFLFQGYAGFQFSDPLIIGVGGAGLARVYTGTATWDPDEIASGASTSTTVTVTNASLGDQVILAFSVAVPAGVLLTGNVTAAHTVTATLGNLSGTNVNLASGTLRASVVRMNS